MKTRMSLRSRMFVLSCGLLVIITMGCIGSLRLSYGQAALRSKAAAINGPATPVSVGNTSVMTAAVVTSESDRLPVGDTTGPLPLEFEKATPLRLEPQAHGADRPARVIHLRAIQFHLHGTNLTATVTATLIPLLGALAPPGEGPPSISKFPPSPTVYADYVVHAAVYDERGSLLGTASAPALPDARLPLEMGISRFTVDFGKSEGYRDAKSFAIAINRLTSKDIVAGGDDIYRFPRDRDAFFRERGITETDYIHFQKDGTYRRIVRAHMGVLTWDRGTWKQEESGVVVLCSKERVRPVQCGPLSIAPGTVELLKAFQPVEKDIANFLARDARQTFPAKEIEEAWKYRSPFGRCMISAVEVDPGTTSIERKQLADLLGAWSRYVRSDTTEISRATPVAYQKKIVLVWHENDSTSWFPDEEPKSIEEKLKRVRESLKNEATTGKPQGPLLFTRIAQQEFEAESRTTQPFLFYPEMNGRIRANPEGDAETEEK